MGIVRTYSVVIDKVSVQNAQDLFTINATANMAFELHSIDIGVEGPTTPEAVTIQVKRASGSFTAGSGGTSATPQPKNTKTAATVTATINNTTQAAAGSGTLTVLAAAPMQLLNGVQNIPIPDDRDTWNPSETMIISLETNMAASHPMSGTIVVAEILRA